MPSHPFLPQKKRDALAQTGNVHTKGLANWSQPTVRPGNLRRYVDLTYLATPLQITILNKTIALKIATIGCNNRMDPKPRNPPALHTLARLRNAECELRNLQSQIVGRNSRRSLKSKIENVRYPCSRILDFFSAQILTGTRIP
jgi:hypothetical protein